MCNIIQSFLPRIKRFSILFCIVASLYLLILPLAQDGFRSVPKSNPIPLYQGWTILCDSVLEASNTTLPHAIVGQNPHTIEMMLTLPEKAFAVESLQFITFQRDVAVYLDDTLLYEHRFSPSALIPNTPGSGVLLVPLPADSAGRVLRIRFEKLVERECSDLGLVQVIDGAISNSNMPVPQNPLFVLMISLVFVALLLLLSCLFYRKLSLGVMPLLSLSLLILSMSFWTLCNSNMLQVYTSNWTFIHHLEYISFFLLPVGLWLYLRHNWAGSSRVSLFMIRVMFAFFALSLFLKCFFHIDFFQLQPVFHILILLNVPPTLFELISAIQRRPLSYRFFCFGLVALIASSLIELAVYYLLSSSAQTANVFMFGSVFMTIFLIFSFLFSTKERLEHDLDLRALAQRDEEHRRYELLVQNTKDIFLDWKMSDDTVYLSKHFSTYFGIPSFRTHFRKNMSRTVAQINYDQDLNTVFSSLRNGSSEQILSGNFIATDGEHRWFETELSCVYDHENRPTRVIGIIRDVTQNKKLSEQFTNQSQYLKINQQLYDQVLEADLSENRMLGEGSMQILHALALPEDISYDEALASIVAQMLDLDHQEAFIATFSSAHLSSLFERGITSFSHECKASLPNDTPRWQRLDARIFRSDATDTLRVLCYIKNIEQEKQRELSLLDSSQRDSLSGLLNKGATRAAIESFLRDFSTEDATHAFLMIDVDNFKTVNDSMGHAVGDRLITELGQLLHAHFRESDIVGRVGGDEFAVLLKNTESQHMLERKCKSLCRSFFGSYAHEENVCEISISIGIARYPTQGTSYDSLYRNADAALYQSKRNGRNTYSFYTPAP